MLCSVPVVIAMPVLLQQLSDVTFAGILLLLILLGLQAWASAVIEEWRAIARPAVRRFDGDEDYLPAEWIRHDHPTADEMEAWCLEQG